MDSKTIMFFVMIVVLIAIILLKNRSNKDKVKALEDAGKAMAESVLNDNKAKTDT